MKTTLYTCHHKASHFLTAENIVPLHLGKSLSFNDIGCFGDNSGDHISSRNPFYCELTGHYWAWKNDTESDVIGLMHYRRHLNLTDSQSLPEDRWGCVNVKMTDDYVEQYGLTDSQVSAYLGDADVVLPKAWDVRLGGSGNNYDHYKKSEHLNIADYDKVLSILTAMYPEYSDAIRRYNQSPFGYYTNMFIMRRGPFIAYSEWLFSILFALEQHIDLGEYDQQQQRVFGHISERLLGVYFTYMQESNALKVKHAQRLFCDEGKFNGHIAPAFSAHCIPIIICFDDNYVHSGGALLNSIIQHSTQTSNYDILILEDRVSEINKSHLVRMVKDLPNFRLRFFDVNAFPEMSRVHTRAHFSPATYARLFIPGMFEQQKKVLFIDADTIVNHDIAELLNIDLGQHLVAAVKDIIMEAFVRTQVRSDESTHFMPARQYLTDYLGLKDPDGYFQAGLLVFNLDLMRKENIFAQLMSTMALKPYWFLDQDIMNFVFQERVLYLPLHWNVFHGNGDANTLFPKLKFATYLQYLDARRDPYMIHFAGSNKPWDEPSVDLSDFYWRALRGTVWYEHGLSRVYKKLRNAKGSFRKISKETAFRNTVKRLLGGVLPPGTRRRQWVARSYLRFLKLLQSVSRH